VESSGLYGKSKIQWLKAESRPNQYVLAPEKATEVDPKVFGEGVAPVSDT